ncbi:ABC transporter ATP-binding protein [Clostridium botulinum]|uniref:ABC transporter ATP-binding protein n=1 Tax=Clostridium botulinum TaxID=1491 RepID=A0A0M1M2M3_CLOBO|nr:ABC transporter ATP-binding protein [Clostridium botulinum]ALT05446.1 peptide ABC transporter ATP-binding protein [Clostridium botulinum]ALT05544.1 peptide ABC transporter ATP-binding protein [Clostridium botulinum]ALT05640.1 peptide ABC transporter ATP-binding protein [Clostridium botulinum]ALT05740.1 peptide ABC transporter ATP-binding protein [Clostridium botulinum]ALT05842.1 peptide ABC transporter ATP-binding protein [Clostridium botulinum]
MCLLRLNEIGKVYGNGDTRIDALKGINININEGDFVAIIGKSGSGKSTLLNILGGIDKPTSGEYHIENENISNFNEKKLAIIRNEYFGFVLQYFGLIKDYTVYENITLPLKYSKKKHYNEKDRVSELLKTLFISDKANVYPTDLSGGQCQRVAIARALINEPRIILADEPTGALDKKTGEQIFELLKNLNNRGMTVIIATHDEKIYKNCKRLIKIEDGKIIFDKNI